MHITFIQAGGTIDKDYPRGEFHHGYDFTITNPAVADILPASNTLFTYEIVEVVKKDSLDMDDQDRQKILDGVNAAKSDRVIITHGSDTIYQTAESLHDKTGNKTVVLTGAMLPEKFTASDAKFNVGMAVAAAQTLTSGVYIAFYGRVVPWREFRAVSQEHEKSPKS